MSETASDTREVMDAHQVADYLGLAVSTVYKKVEYREIPFTKVGTLLRFPKWLIDRWLTERAVRPDETLYRKFVRMQARYHLEQFLLSKGLDPSRMTEDQLFQELKAAIEELQKAEEAERAAR